MVRFHLYSRDTCGVISPTICSFRLSEVLLNPFQAMAFPSVHASASDLKSTVKLFFFFLLWRHLAGTIVIMIIMFYWDCHGDEWGVVRIKAAQKVMSWVHACVCVPKRGGGRWDAGFINFNLPQTLKWGEEIIIILFSFPSKSARDAILRSLSLVSFEREDNPTLKLDGSVSIVEWNASVDNGMKARVTSKYSPVLSPGNMWSGMEEKYSRIPYSIGENKFKLHPMSEVFSIMGDRGHFARDSGWSDTLGEKRSLESDSS